jgi:hypothetical protein
MHKNIFITILAFFLCNISFAEIDAVGAVSTATGGSGRGAIETVDGIYLNPAFLRDFTGQNFSYNYTRDAWALSLTDSGTDSLFPAGLQLINLKTETLETQKLGLTFAAPRWKKLAFGATTSMVEYMEKNSGVMGDKYRQGVVDLGITVAINSKIGFGLTANKVASSQVKIAENVQLQKTMGMGISYIINDFARFRFDMETGPDNKTNRLIYMAGMENFLNDWMIFRMGFQKNNVVSKDYITAGMGFAGPQFTLHYAYIADASDQTDQKHLFDLGIPF